MDEFSKEGVGPRAKGQLGPQVDIKTKKLDSRPDASVWLDEAGRKLAQPGQSYIGTIALYVYKPSVGATQLDFITHCTAGIDDVSENVIAYGMNLHNLNVLDRYGKKPKTRK